MEVFLFPQGSFSQDLNLDHGEGFFYRMNIYGSLFIPSKQFLARFKFRPWRGVYLSNKYLNSMEESVKITKNIIDFYLNNSIIPLVETELSTEKQFVEAQNFIAL